MATKYGEVVLAVKYREVDDRGEHAGGPMYAIKNGLGAHWRWLGTAFALFGGLAGFGIGNMVQANGIASAVHNAFGVPAWLSGLVADTLNALMAIPNLISLLLLSPLIVGLTRAYFDRPQDARSGP
jgi:AGCS family alanine or glycine:cation symporter